jgi:hypothetical protein
MRPPACSGSNPALDTAHPLYPNIRELVLKTSGLADVINHAIGNEKGIKVSSASRGCLRRS